MAKEDKKLLIVGITAVIFVFSVVSNTTAKELFRLYDAPVISITMAQCVLSACAASVLSYVLTSNVGTKKKETARQERRTRETTGADGLAEKDEDEDNDNDTDDDIVSSGVFTRQEIEEERRKHRVVIEKQDEIMVTEIDMTGFPDTIKQPRIEGKGSETSSLLIDLTLIAACHCAGFLATNYAFASTMPLSMALMIKAAEPMFTAALSYVYGERYHFRRYLTLIPIVAGISLACYGDERIAWKAMLTALVSNCGFAGRSVLSKHAMHCHRWLTDRELFGFTAAISVVLLLPSWYVFEIHSGQGGLWDVLAWRHHILAVVILNASSYFVYNHASTILLTHTTPLTHVIVNSVRRVLGIVLSIVYYGTPLTLANGAGMVVTFIGVYLYAISAKKKRAKSQHDLPERTIGLP